MTKRRNGTTRVSVPGRRQRKTVIFISPRSAVFFFGCALLVVALEGRPGEIISREPFCIAFSDQFLKSPGQARNTDKTDERATGGNNIVHVFRDRKTAFVSDRLSPSLPLRAPGGPHYLNEGLFGGNRVELLVLPTP